jgi:hypothetical protein
MKLNIRMLKDSDWDTLVEWWLSWKDWQAHPTKDMLPDNGKGGFIVEYNNKPIVAGFLYLTNSKVGWLEWIISNPKYKGKNRKEALELLITGVENVAKQQGCTCILSIGRNKSLIKIHEKLGYTIDPKHSYEISKNIQ